MPYKSGAQRRFMHAQHPEIASKWDQEIRTKKKKGKYRKPPERVKKSSKGWLQPLGIGIGSSVVGGAVANQIPPVRVNRKRNQLPEVQVQRKKGKVAKMLVPVHDDPFFNHEAAQKAFDLVMKMDDETAEMFVHIVASDLLEREVELNRITLQKHLDEVIAKRLADVKQATLRAVSKGMDTPLPYAQALAIIDALISKASAHDDDNIPNFMFERRIKRDPTSGRFQTKISNKPLAKKPLPDKTAAAMNIEGTTAERYKRLSSEDKARYQNQYMQVAEFLNTVNAATGEGNNDVLLHYKNDRTGETWADKHGGGKPDVDSLLKTNVRVVGAEALPTALTAGGAAFSLAGAMGGGMTSGQVAGINTADAAMKSGDWTKAWLNGPPNTHQNQNARLYSRTKTLGEAASALAPDGGKVQLAGAMAEIVGQYGPQAEEVLGPSARKTAYRYRGTERTPDERLVSMYDAAIKANKRAGPIDPWAAQAEARIRQSRGAGKQPFGSESGVRGKGSARPSPQPGVAPALVQMVAEREANANRAPEWREREIGRAAVSQYLMDELPSKKYYKLQLASGNTPPSEGVIINSQGQIVTQAVGYGDDHYLPFNLKNLKGLKGGEYVRNRSVGGLTSEDIYTGLISGARRVTVVSRSGTFTMEFKEDFRGGRRHNDKARRMTRRYEQILDAVQSEQVERADVPIRWRKMIEEEVKGEYGPNASSRLVRAEIDARIKEFKTNPQINGRDMDRAEAAISRVEEQEKRGEVSRQDVADYRKEIMGELRDLKEIHFRLNGIGYTAALDSLREQFPYYIEAAAIPKEEHLEEYERDLGYVEPARNRPTEAKAGWYGTRHEESGKYSAAFADYQRGLPGTPKPHGSVREDGKFVATGTASATSSSSGPSGGVRSERDKTRDRLADELERGQSREQVKSKAVALQQSIKNNAIAAPAGSTPPWWNMTEGEMHEHLDNPENMDKFHAWVGANEALEQTAASRHLQEYRNTKNRAGGGVSYEAKHANTWQAAPYKFGSDRDAYRPSPESAAVDIEIRRLDGVDASLRFGQPLSALTEKQLREEFELTKGMREAMRSAKTYGDAAQDAMGSRFANPGSAFATRFFRDDKGAETHLENIHRMRYLKTKRGPSGPPGGGGAAASGGSTGFTPPPTGGPPAPTRVSGGGGPGHLVPAAGATVEANNLVSQDIERARKGWVAAAEKVQAGTSGDDWNALENFVAGIKSTRGASSFSAHDAWIDDLPDELKPKVHEALQSALR